LHDVSAAVDGSFSHAKQQKNLFVETSNARIEYPYDFKVISGRPNILRFDERIPG
jgi:hypothetical protein